MSIKIQTQTNEYIKHLEMTVSLMLKISFFINLEIVQRRANFLDENLIA